MASSEGGDPVCWVQFTCQECGAFPDDRTATTCWRCEIPLHLSEEETTQELA